MGISTVSSDAVPPTAVVIFGKLILLRMRVWQGYGSELLLSMAFLCEKTGGYGKKMLPYYGNVLLPGTPGLQLQSRFLTFLGMALG